MADRARDETLVSLFNDESREKQSQQLERVFDREDETEPLDEGVSPFTADVDLLDLKTVDTPQEIHSERSKKSRETDEAFNAPLTLDKEKWRENPDEYDYPGVDTIPRDEVNRRGEQAVEAGKQAEVIDRVNEGEDLGPGVSGKAISGPMFNTVETTEAVAQDSETDPRFQRGAVLAHEAGHLVDAAAGNEIAGILREDDELRDEAREISEQMRGTFETASEDRRQYRAEDANEGSRELIADFFASAVTQPRATKRDAPELVEAVSERTNIDDVFEDDDFGLFGR